MRTISESELMCKDCAWFVAPRPGANLGDCHRYPPGIVSEGGWDWAGVEPDDWCGEFSPNTDLAEEKLNPSGS